MANENDFDTTQHFGDKHASIYDEKIRKVIRGYEEMHDLAYYLLKDSLPEKAKILVLGLGTAHEAITYAENQDGWDIIGVDPTSEMVNSSRNRISQLGLNDRIKVVEGRVEDITERSFDASSSILVMQFMKDNGDKEKYLRNISARMNKGAKLVLIDLEGEKGSAEFNLLLSAWKSHQYSTRCDKGQIDRDFEHIDTDLQFIPEKGSLACCIPPDLLVCANFTNRTYSVAI